jgi:hypothetical protein
MSSSPQKYSRSNYVKQLCTQYVREFCPDIWKKIQEESFKKYPPAKPRNKYDLSKILAE